MNKLKIFISAFYALSVLIITFCVPISAIIIICKLCSATTLPWINCCVPLIISISLAPFIIIFKFLIDKEG